MALNKTPGVYVEEISNLPSAVAQVETSIPAFIGFTEKAQEKGPDDLIRKPTRIRSMAEFESFFGSNAQQEIKEVKVNFKNKFLSARVANKFFLYDSLQLFYANGGADCYIVSVGNYQVTRIEAALFTGGIQALEKEKDPTILLYPDAVLLSDDDLAIVQQEALKQSHQLRDRICLLDLKQDDPKGTTFRNKVGINYLSYGAAYTPWLKISKPIKAIFPDIKKIKRKGVEVTLRELTSDTEILAKIAAVEKGYADKEKIDSMTTALAHPFRTLADKFGNLENSFNELKNDSELHKLFQFVYKIAAQIDRLIDDEDPEVVTLTELKSEIKVAVNSYFDPVYAKVVSLELELESRLPSYAAIRISSVAPISRWPRLYTATVLNVLPACSETDDKVRVAALTNLSLFFGRISNAYESMVKNAAARYAKTTDEDLAQIFPVYKSILNGISKSMISIPPSGAVAGIYAMVDRTRGVWKSPANVSLSNVVAPEVIFTQPELGALNVDPIEGKSINAIRLFPGKGTVVWGARTLAGNDHEWRYVNVRRFYNMVEESCKRSTENFVFEPNNAHTWTKVQSMVENYLFLLWRQGALQGAKPENAFFVRVGLGKTMTPQDVLEGRMIVEMGMAVIRPAEFIILRYSHNLASSGNFSTLPTQDISDKSIPVATHPLQQFQILVYWDQDTLLRFSEVSGLDEQPQLPEYREGSRLKDYIAKIPGLHKFSNITLKRGIMAVKSDLYKRARTPSFYVENRDMVIILLNEKQVPVMKWKIRRAIPVKFQVSDLKADGNEVAIETLEIAHEGLSLESTE